MVLTRAQGIAAVVFLAACITARPPPRTPKPTAVALSIVVEREEGSPVAAPSSLAAQLTKSLATRNLVVKTLDISTSAAGRRTTQARLQDMAARCGDAPILMLVEMRVIYDTQLDTKFRWSVFAKTSIARATDLNSALTQQSTFAAFLDYDHEREPEAAAATAPQVADQATRLTDDLISDANAAKSRTTMSLPLREEPARSHADSIYFVMVDRFANGDASNDANVDKGDPQAFHGGDLQGLIQRLDYLQDLGIETVWISPVFKTRPEKLDGHGAFHGYWVEDFGEIDARFGSEAALVKLSDELHRRGMKLYMDVVLNHVAYDAPLTKSHPQWFHHNGDIRDWNDTAQLQNNDVHGLPDLAQERSDVYDYLLKTSRHWIDTVHPDGFRLDAVKHIPAAFWAKYNDDIHRHTGPGFVLLGENLDGRVPEIDGTWRVGHFNSLFDFPLHFAAVDVFCRDVSPEKLGAVLSEDRRYAHPERLATLLDNHDLPRIESACHGDEGRVRQALMFLLLGRGVPVLTYGTESAMAGEHEPENRGDMKFYGPLTGYIRSMLRTRGELADLVQEPCILVPTQGALGCIKRNGARALIIAVNHDSASGLWLPLPRTYAMMTNLANGEETEPKTGGPSAMTIESGVTEALLVRAADPADLDSWISELRHDGDMVLAFTVRNAPALQTGDRLYLAGSGVEFGDWKAEKGIAFEPALTATATLPTSAVFEAKLVIRHSDGTEQWEEGGNRYIYYADNGANRCLSWSHGNCDVM